MLTRLLARCTGAMAGALLFGQSAEWTQQYLQRLGGAADELAALVQRFDDSAAAEGLTRPEALHRLNGAADGWVRRQGADAETAIGRAETTERRYRALLSTAPLLRPITAVADLDIGIARRTLQDFRPALPVTPDGLALTGAGFLAGWSAGAGLAGLARRRPSRADRPI